MEQSQEFFSFVVTSVHNSISVIIFTSPSEKVFKDMLFIIIAIFSINSNPRNMSGFLSECSCFSACLMQQLEAFLGLCARLDFFEIQLGTSWTLFCNFVDFYEQKVDFCLSTRKETDFIIFVRDHCHSTALNLVSVAFLLSMMAFNDYSLLSVVSYGSFPEGNDRNFDHFVEILSFEGTFEALFKESSCVRTKHFCINL